MWPPLPGRGKRSVDKTGQPWPSDMVSGSPSLRQLSAECACRITGASRAANVATAAVSASMAPQLTRLDSSNLLVRFDQLSLPLGISCDRDNRVIGIEVGSEAERLCSV